MTITIQMKLNGSKVTLTGNTLTGDTYRIKDYIKNSLGGKWNAESKGWVISEEKMAHVMTLGNCYVYPATSPEAKAAAQPSSYYCKKCGGYCYGDCNAN